MRKFQIKKLIGTSILIALLALCCVAFCACHVIPWYIPIPYNDKEMDVIYSYIKDKHLSDSAPYKATVSLEDDGKVYGYNVYAENGKFVISYVVYGYGEDGFYDNALTRGLFCDGKLYEWDVQTRTETVTDKDIADYSFLFERVRETVEYFKTEVIDVMPYTDDSYSHKCFPWGLGMVQMYYTPLDDKELSISASWTVEKDKNAQGGLSIYEADFRYWKGENGVSIITYDEPYGLDESIPNIMSSYEQLKETDRQMLYKQIYVKGFEDTLVLELYNNDAAKALLQKLGSGDITITLDDYGGFEKTGMLGFTLPTDDKQVTTKYGDVMQYQGNQISIFYGENTWEYTPIGYIAGYSDSAFRDVIQAGKGKVQITLTLSKN